MSSVTRAFRAFLLCSTVLAITSADFEGVAQTPSAASSSSAQIPFRDAQALQLLEASLEKMGGTAFWSTIHSAKVSGTREAAGQAVDSFVWKEDWGIGKFRFRHETESPSGLHVRTGDPSQGSFLQANGESKQLPSHVDDAAVPLELPGAMLYTILSGKDYEIRQAENPGRDFPKDICVGVVQPRDRLTTQEWLINPVTQLPDEILIRAYNLRHPHLPVMIGVTYLHFSKNAAAFVPDTLNLNTAGFHEAVVLQPTEFNVAVQDSDFRPGR